MQASAASGTLLASAATGLALGGWHLFKVLNRRKAVLACVEVAGCGAVAVSTVQSGGNTLVSLDWDQIFGSLPFKIPFCSAVLTSDGTIYVSGTIGLAPPKPGAKPSIISGGPKAEMIRTMEIIEACIKACGAQGVENITMAHCYLVDNTPERFAEMNAGYLEFMADRPLPARITVGCSALALGAVVEVDVIAKM